MVWGYHRMAGHCALARESSYACARGGSCGRSLLSKKSCGSVSVRGAGRVVLCAGGATRGQGSSDACWLRRLNGEEGRRQVAPGRVTPASEWCPTPRS
jgi:hypothetical protein